MPHPDPTQIEAAILDAVHERGAGKTICPSEVARALSADWRGLMDPVRSVSADLADKDRIVVTQKGQPVDATTARGPIRLGLPDAQQTG